MSSIAGNMPTDLERKGGATHARDALSRSGLAVDNQARAQARFRHEDGFLEEGGGMAHQFRIRLVALSLLPCALAVASPTRRADGVSVISRPADRRVDVTIDGQAFTSYN